MIAIVNSSQPTANVTNDTDQARNLTVLNITNQALYYQGWEVKNSLSQTERD